MSVLAEVKIAKKVSEYKKEVQELFLKHAFLITTTT